MTKKSKIDHYTDKEALDFHNKGKSGKIEIVSSKSLSLSFGYPTIKSEDSAISDLSDLNLSTIFL